MSAHNPPTWRTEESNIPPDDIHRQPYIKVLPFTADYEKEANDADTQDTEKRVDQIEVSLRILSQ